MGGSSRIGARSSAPRSGGARAPALGSARAEIRQDRHSRGKGNEEGTARRKIFSGVQLIQSDAVANINSAKSDLGFRSARSITLNFESSIRSDEEVRKERRR